jgi:2-iminobutanoate/2-iminopropanoate deaminase
MTTIEYLAPGGRFATPPLSAATRMGNLLFVSGTPGYYDDGSIDEGDFGRQFDHALVVLREVLARGGSSLASLLKVNVLLTRASDVAEMNRRYAAALGAGPYPARTTSWCSRCPIRACCWRSNAWLWSRGRSHERRVPDRHGGLSGHDQPGLRGPARCVRAPARHPGACAG